MRYIPAILAVLVSIGIILGVLIIIGAILAVFGAMLLAVF